VEARSSAFESGDPTVSVAWPVIVPELTNTLNWPCATEVTRLIFVAPDARNIYLNFNDAGINAINRRA
jgi:hypothetical protein